MAKYASLTVRRQRLCSAQSFWRIVCHNFLFPIMNRFGDRDRAHKLRHRQAGDALLFVSGCFCDAGGG